MCFGQYQGSSAACMHLTAFCAWDSTLNLLVTPAQLMRLVSHLCPDPLARVRKRVWCSELTFLVWDLVCMQCMGNAIIAFFTPFDPAPDDKKCRSEHQTLFPLFGGVWARDYDETWYWNTFCAVGDFTWHLSLQPNHLDKNFVVHWSFMYAWIYQSYHILSKNTSPIVGTY